MNKRLLILVLIMVSGLCLSVQAQQRNVKVKAASEISGEKIFIKQADKSLALIEEAAQKISIKGVAVVAFIPGDISKSWISKMKVVGNLTTESANLLGIAYTKASEMADTHKDSGSGVRKVLSGELGYHGGLIRKVNSGYILAVFSGGSGEQDLEVAKTGLDWLSEFYPMMDSE